MSMNYDIHEINWPHPGEKGYIDVSTSGPCNLRAELAVDLTGPTVHVTCSGVQLTGPAVNVGVHCTGASAEAGAPATCGDIPSGDISSAVQSKFPSVLQSTVLNAINQASKHFDSIPTSFKLPELSLAVSLEGGFVAYPIDTQPNIVLYGKGAFTGSNPVPPPFSPTFVPPNNVFQSPANGIDFLVTPYLLRTAIWALDQDGKFNIKVTPADVPPNSPVKLNTDSPAFKAAVPGLAAYPNMNITIGLSLVNASDVEMSPKGTEFVNTFNAVFTLVNATLTQPGFTILADVNFDVNVTPAVSSQSISLEAKTGDFASSIQLVSSSLGTVNVPSSSSF
eukprot:TRINITY_DN3189_c0_g1_i5.p1 TRINITY_DN3189_c0_g1~~TRINITY_DN3189_c0_g1_i5.p1  ORF type:complete len:336 (+),score=91.47 TRINITY_DN3189_c0_g1_i5:1095-2102(+)